MKRYLPLLAQLSSEIILGFSYIFLALGMSYLDQDAPRYLAIRYTIATLCFTLLVLVGFKKVKYSFKGLPILLACGLFNPILSQLAKTTSTTYVPTSRLAVCNSIIPVVMIGLSVLFNREYPTKKQMLFIGTTVVGMLIANMESWTMDGQAVELVGYLWVIFYILTISMARVCVRRATGRYSSFEISYFATAVGCVGFITMDAMSISMTPITAQIPLLIDPVFAAALVYSSIGTCVLAFLLMNYASANLPFAVYSSTCTLNVVVGILAGIFIMGDAFTIHEALGAVIILGSIIGISFTYDKSKGKNKYSDLKAK